MASREDIPPNYDRAKVEAVMLEVAAELNPSRPTEGELIAKVVANRDDEREVETARKALGGLREFGLVRGGDGDPVELTPAALRAVGLLGGDDDYL